MIHINNFLFIVPEKKENGTSETPDIHILYICICAFHNYIVYVYICLFSLVRSSRVVSEDEGCNCDHQKSFIFFCP